MGLREEIDDIKNEVNTLKDESLAMEILKDYKKSTKRLFSILIVVIILWFATIGYLVYVLNDIGTIENTQEVSDIDNIENSSIINGG